MQKLEIFLMWLRILLIRFLSISVVWAFIMVYGVNSALSFWGCSLGTVLCCLLFMVLLNKHGYCVSDESDGSQEEQDCDKADVWSGTGELEIGLSLVVGEINSVHCNANWRALLIDGIGSFIEWWGRAFDECLVDVDRWGFTESTELASHAWHAGWAR